VGRSEKAGILRSRRPKISSMSALPRAGLHVSGGSRNSSRAGPGSQLRRSSRVPSGRKWDAATSSRKSQPVASASGRARCSPGGAIPSFSLRAPKAWLSRSGQMRRARDRVSTQWIRGSPIPRRPAASSRKARSKGALWATTTAPASRSRTPGRTSARGGARRSLSAEIPVSSSTSLGRNATRTSVWNRSRGLPPANRTQAISRISSRLGSSPVVSRSNAKNSISG